MNRASTSPTGAHATKGHTMSTTTPAKPEAKPATVRQFTIDVDLTKDVMVNLIECAGFGIRYWADRAEVDDDAETYRIRLSEECKDDHPSGERWFTLTHDQLRDALMAWTVKYGPDWWIREIRDGDLAGDSDVGDGMVQTAIFGDTIYG
jgi:hypothetical protein